MLMCANDVVISRRVQMERDINTDATGNEVWVHRHLCACVSEMHGGMLLCLTVWNTVEKKGLRDSYFLTPPHPTPPPSSPGTLTPFARPTGRHTDPQSVFVCPASQMNTFVYFRLDI